MNYLRVKNWEEFQHYRDRSPPWIKLHRDLLRDYRFTCLQDASKLHLVLIWLLASQMDNMIPADEVFIKNQIGISGELNLKELIDNGFLVDDSGTLAGCKHDAIPETEAKAKTKAEYRDKIQRKNKNEFEKPEDVFGEVWDDFLKHRKSKKALVTKTVIDRIRKEAAIANWSLEDALIEIMAKNWQGFNHEWVKAKPNEKKNDWMNGYDFK